MRSQKLTTIILTNGAGVFIGAPPVVGAFLATFKDYPPSQRPASFSIDQRVDKLERQLDSVQSR
jgi:arylsulfatase